MSSGKGKWRGQWLLTVEGVEVLSRWGATALSMPQIAWVCVCAHFGKRWPRRTYRMRARTCAYCAVSATWRTVDAEAQLPQLPPALHSPVEPPCCQGFQPRRTSKCAGGRSCLTALTPHNLYNRCRHDGWDCVQCAASLHSPHPSVRRSRGESSRLSGRCAGEWADNGGCRDGVWRYRLSSRTLTPWVASGVSSVSCPPAPASSELRREVGADPRLSSACGGSAITTRVPSPARASPRGAWLIRKHSSPAATAS